MIQVGLLKIFHLPDYGHWSGMSQIDPRELVSVLMEIVGGRWSLSPMMTSYKANNENSERSLENEESKS